MERFTKITDANGEHIITRDNKTGLEWAVLGIRECTNELGNSEAEQECRDYRLGGHDDWRLPTIDELLTLVDRSCYGPATDVDAFPHWCVWELWTSTPNVTRLYQRAWVVNFYEGSCDTARRERCYGVLPVRDARRARST